MTHVTLQYFDGCPSWQATDERLRLLSDELGFRLEHQLVETPEEADAVGFRGSPTILIDGTESDSATRWRTHHDSAKHHGVRPGGHRRGNRPAR